ncbi:putative NAD-dependent protein-ADP-ribosyltransferase YbiA (DUF1768 family) [Chryseobacterium ginsenosidimutans]|uniref:NAD-dependent protein-ADP-ribosyltransferase YbiA (DUF1768 family) n=1 Tax=Chryseobacterium geocarposphaerae TaxID=1416776 RepID=A0ABU1LEA2_9FLAO|nr:putative NAD-dependent protein-ADP-ribosyltransferase YbiA (DUF1768 family) [Chryseobacterium geocarposphaerae]MDR6697835.1 putative NAD-dependent protein-ADP-ribosyltransferase YbiA (DUF1768 family) [Chryseobacterium ginsenosidimutans]
MKYTLKNIIERFQKKEELQFLFFWGHTGRSEVTKAFFSQWFPSQFEENKIVYKTLNII